MPNAPTPDLPVDMASAEGWRKWIPVASTLGVALYALAVFLSCIQREPRWWSLVPFLLPLCYWLGAAVAHGLRRPHWFWPVQAIVFAMLGSLLGWMALHPSALLASPERIRVFYFVQEAVMSWTMIAVFARSLLPGRVPFCSAVAVLSHPVMTPTLWRYTRQVTLAWAAWITGLWLVSATLFFVASPTTWAFASTVVAPLLTGAFFVIEVFSRRFFLPPADRTGLLLTLNTMRKVNWADFFGQLAQGQPITKPAPAHEAAPASSK